MNPPIDSSMPVSPLVFTVSDQAPTKEGMADNLLKARQVNYESYQPDYSYTPMYQPPYYPSYQAPYYPSDTPTYRPTPTNPEGPTYTPNYPAWAPTPKANGPTFHQGYEYSAPLAPNTHPNDVSRPGAERAIGTLGNFFAKMLQPHGNHPSGVSRWTGDVGGRGGRPVTANLSLWVDGTAAVAFQVSSEGADASRFSSDEQAYRNAIESQNTLRK